MGSHKQKETAADYGDIIILTRTAMACNTAAFDPPTRGLSLSLELLPYFLFQMDEMPERLQIEPQR
jgi:hypothetical protein